MIKYKVEVYPNGDKFWYLNGKCHREDGPAIEYADGTKYWYLNGERMSKAEHKKATSKPTCEGKEVEVDGVTYVLRLRGE